MTDAKPAAPDTEEWAREVNAEMLAYLYDEGEQEVVELLTKASLRYSRAAREVATKPCRLPDCAHVCPTSAYMNARLAAHLANLARKRMKWPLV